jgi:hypothetical protein
LKLVFTRPPQEDASVRCGRSVADPPDDPVVVEAAGEFAERLVALLHGRESMQPEELLLQGADESRDAAIADLHPKTDPSAIKVPTGPGWALETLDETDTTHS